MTVTNAKIITDRTEYCKYQSDMKTVVVTMSTLTGTLIEAEQYVFEIRRQPSTSWPDAYCTVMTKTISATSGDVSRNSVIASFSIGIDDLDEDHIERLITGKYLVRVYAKTSPNVFWYAANTIRISLVTIKEIRTDWCYGIPLRASEVMGVKIQPKVVVGVSIDEVSQETTPGIRNLVLTYASATWTLAWDGGTPVLLSSTTSDTYLLMDEIETNYIMVSVTPSLLPQMGVTEKILVVQNEMTDTLIQRRIDAAMSQVESQLGFAIEPYLYTSMPQYAGENNEKNQRHQYWDRIARPADYFVPTGGLTWPNFKLPYQWCVKIHDLYGLHQNDRLIQVNKQWFTTTVDRMTGFVTLVPALGSIAQWTVFTHPMLAPYYMFYGFGNIPAFWNYSATIGIPDLRDADRHIILELLARTAAASILIEAQRGYQGGLGSQSTSRDGLSNSFSYNPQGPYGSTIAEHRQWIATEIPRIKTKLGGLLMVTLGS